MDKDVAHIYNGILLSHEKKKILPFAATWMELEMITLSEASHREKDTSHLTSHMWHLENEHIYKTYKQTHKIETDSQT